MSLWPAVQSPWGQAAAAVLGAILGSFFNVVRVRFPRGESLWRPRSSCPQCRRPVRPYDNIPVLSFLILRGRCRDCGLPISWQYPLVELCGALVLWLSVRTAGGPLEAAFSALFALGLVLVLFIDLEHQIIPDIITLPGIVLGITAGFWLEDGVGTRLAGAAAGSLGLFALGGLYKLLTGVEGLGLGDVKLMGMVGAFLGWQGALGVVLLGSLAGSLAGLALVAAGRAGRRTMLPFGSFLAPAAWAILFWGPALWSAYRSLWNLVGG
ncbi:MAG: prepilin peptidase [Candidatus Eisenbacteria bacterium]|nr:prepilin peptidase [Candidatus Eisenbacteria bacterium]